MDHRVGEIIRTARLAKGWTLEDVAAQAGVTKSAVSRWEGCWRSPFSFRARNGFGALRLTHVEIWTKNGEILQNRFEE